MFTSQSSNHQSASYFSWLGIQIKKKKKKMGNEIFKKSALIWTSIDTMPLQIIRKTNSTQLVLDSHNGSQALWKLLRATNSSTSSEYRLESNTYIKGLICERSAYILLTSFNIITTLPTLTNSREQREQLANWVVHRPKWLTSL